MSHSYEREIKDLHSPDGAILVGDFDCMEVSGDSRWGFLGKTIKRRAYLHIVDLAKGTLQRTIADSYLHNPCWDDSRQRLAFTVITAVGRVASRVEILDCTKPEVGHRIVFQEKGHEALLRSNLWSPTGDSIAFVVTRDLPEQPLRHSFVHVQLSDPPVLHEIKEVRDENVRFEWRVSWKDGQPNTRVAGPGD